MTLRAFSSDFVMPDLAELGTAASLVYSVMPPTPQYHWPLLSARVGAEVWVKHENHTGVGAFKVRGGIVYLAELRRTHPQLKGVICATRGNHGQSVAVAAARAGLGATIVVPLGNGREKNAAILALGATLIEHGEDFQAAFEYAVALASHRGLHMIPTFHRSLVVGVASAGLEFLRAVRDLHTLYVPLGMGSGVCAAIAARDALDVSTRIVGVVAEGAPAYRLSLEAGRPVSTERAVTIADGIACRVPDADAFAVIQRGVERIVQVSDSEIEAAMRHYFTDTHNVAEGAGAAPLAALLRDCSQMAGKRVGLVLSGGNVDRETYARVLGAAAVGAS
jgi:threonine dehydratase